MSSKQCSLCHREIAGNVNSGKFLICGHCTQVLLIAAKENKVAYRDKLLSEGHTEEARAIQSFITPEEEVNHGEASRKFRPVVVRKRFSRAIRATFGQRRPLHNHHILGERRAEVR